MFRQCPTWCSLSLFWFAVENSNFVQNTSQNKDKLDGVRIPALTPFIFLVFLKGTDYMLYHGVSFLMPDGVGVEEDYKCLRSQRGGKTRTTSEGYGW